LQTLSNALSVVQTQGADTLNRVDAGLSWRPAKQWLVSVWGRNLQSARHRESPDATFAGPAGEVPRSVTVKLSWQSKPAGTSSH
jgi:outer membrane receptor protein involved in Fe transport